MLCDKGTWREPANQYAAVRSQLNQAVRGSVGGGRVTLYRGCFTMRDGHLRGFGCSLLPRLVDLVHTVFEESLAPARQTTISATQRWKGGSAENR